MAEKRRGGKDAKFWAQAVRRSPTTPIAPTSPVERRPWVSTAHLHISAPGIERTTLTHMADGHHSPPYLDDVGHVLHATYGSTAGVRIETTNAVFELLVFYMNAESNRPASLVLKTGKPIQTSRKAGLNQYSMDDGARKATLSPYFDDKVEFWGFTVRSVTDII